MTRTIDVGQSVRTVRHAKNPDSIKFQGALASALRQENTMAPPEPIHDIAHLGAVELMTPKADKSLWYFRDVLGMEVVHSAGRSVYLRGYGDYAASTLKLTEAKIPGVGCVSWRAVSPEALDRRVRGDRGGRTRAGLEQRGFRPRPHLPLPRPRRPPDGDLLRGAEIRGAAGAAFGAQEPAAEIHRPRRRRAPHRPSRAAGQGRRGEPQVRRPSRSASSCASRSATTTARPRSARG